MVPNDWERKPIKDLCESIIDCVNKTAKHVEHVTPFKIIVCVGPAQKLRNND